MFTASFVYEFYQRESAKDATTFDRKNYYVKILRNDIPVKIPGVDCE